MKLRFLLSGILAVICVAVLWNALARHRQIAALRAEQQQLLDQAAAPPDAPDSAADAQSQSNSPANASVSPELLRLRSEVTRLMGRQRELSGVRGENERLRTQLAARGTNTSAAATALPPGYLTRSQAKWAGYTTPENTLQSFVWAIQNRDFTKLLETMTPDSARSMREALQASGDSSEQVFEEGLAHFPGFRIVDHQPQPDGSMELKVEIVPGDPEAQPMRARLIDGQWKLELR